MPRFSLNNLVSKPDLLKALLCLLVLCAAPSTPQAQPAPSTPGHAGDGASTAATDTQDSGATDLISSLLSNASLRDKFRLDFGSLSGLSKGGNTAFWYMLRFDGKNLFTRGTQPTFANVFGQVNPTANNVAVTAAAKVAKLGSANAAGGGNGSDPNSLSLRIERRQPGDNLADANVLANRSIRLSSKSEIRGVLQFTARSDFRQYNIAGGLETPSLTPLRFLNSGRRGGLGLVNWLFLGVSGENQKRPGSEGGDQDVALTSYRAFLGRGFGLVESDASRAVRQVRTDQSPLVVNIRKNTEGADGNVDIGKLRETLKRAVAAAGTNNATPEDSLVLSLVREFITTVKQDQRSIGDLLKDENKAKFDEYITEMASKPPTRPLDPQNPIAFRNNWEKHVLGNVRGYLLPLRDRARYELYAESAGWYYLNGHFKTDRFQNIFSANFKINLRPETDNNLFFLLRYENGRERSSPLVYKNQLAVSVGITF